MSMEDHVDAIEAEVEGTFAEIRERFARSVGSRGEDLLPTHEPWRRAGRLFEVDALVVPKRTTTEHGRWALGTWPTAVRSFALTCGALPAVYFGHANYDRSGTRASYGAVVGYWIDRAGFHLRAVTALQPRPGDGVSHGVVMSASAEDDDSDEAISSLLHELSLLRPPLQAGVKGAHVEAVRQFAGTPGDVRWLDAL